MKKARQRYNELSSHREQFLEVAYECAELTIPTLIMRNETNNYQSFVTPWQSVGAKGVVAHAVHAPVVAHAAAPVAVLG